MQLSTFKKAMLDGESIKWDWVKKLTESNPVLRDSYFSIIYLSEKATRMAAERKWRNG